MGESLIQPCRVSEEGPRVVKVFAPGFSSLMKVLYTPQAFFTHAALLDQAFAHCLIFPTAASRRSLGRVSVPVWLIILSDQLRIVAFVSRYLTNPVSYTHLTLPTKA